MCKLFKVLIMLILMIVILNTVLSRVRQADIEPEFQCVFENGNPFFSEVS